MKKFRCYDCGHQFEAEGTLKDYNDALYGPCSKWVAVCPDCGSDAGQYADNPGKSSKEETMPSCGNYGCCSGCGM